MEDADSEIHDLLRRIRRGDRDARRELIEKLADQDCFGRDLRAMARRALSAIPPARRLADSHDITQSALADALVKISEFRGDDESSLFAWLKTIIRTKVVRASRQRLPEVIERVEDIDPLDHLIFDELVDALRAAVHRLPTEQRLVVELRLRGVNATKSGALLGLKPVTVRKREQRAVEKLRTLMDG